MISTEMNECMHVQKYHEYQRYAFLLISRGYEKLRIGRGVFEEVEVVGEIGIGFK